MTNWNYVIRNMAPNANPAIVSMVADHADEQFAKWEINSIRRQATILAHACVETQGFTKLEENLRYSAKRLTEVWPKRFPTLAAAMPFSADPVALANEVYGGRMGNRKGTNDGYDNRGKGLWQCTGRENCAEVGKALGVTPEVASAWLIDPAHALECACALFHILKVGPAADAGDVTAQTRRINGGKNSLAERKAAFAKSMRLLSATEAVQHISKMGSGDPDAEHQVVTARDLRASGSRTIKGADQAQTGLAGAVASIGAASAVLDQTQSVVAQAQSAVETAQTTASYLAWAQQHWQVLTLAGLLIVAAYFIWRAWSGASLIKMARVDDANTGVNVAR